MARFTFRNGNGKYAMLINGCEYTGRLADMLAAYENTGLTPEDINALQTHPDHAYADSVKEMWKNIGGMPRMEEIAKAEAEGRVIIIPKKNAHGGW